MRIVSMTPSATEILCGLGLAESVVGISLACDYPREICDRPRVTGNLVPPDVKTYVRATRLAVREAAKRRAVLAVPRVGDPCLSSGLKGLLRALEPFDVQVIPAVSSIQLAAALARIDIDESVAVSFHSFGDPEEKKQFMLDCFRGGRHLILLASPDLMPVACAAWLIEQGVSPNVPVVVGSFLIQPKPQIVRTRLRRLVGREFPWLSVSVVMNPSDPSLEEDHRSWLRWRRMQKIIARERR